jgi:hypothetical protein
LFDVAGINVTLLARGNRRPQLEYQGIQIQPLGKMPLSPRRIAIIDELPTTPTFDVGILLMRKNKALLYRENIAQHDCCEQWIVMGNNVKGYDEYLSTIPANRLHLGFVKIGGRTREGITEATYSMDSILTVGENPNHPGSKEFLGRWQYFLKEHGFGIEITPNIDAWLKHHAALVVPLAFALYYVGGNLNSPEYLKRKIKEAIKVSKYLCNGLEQQGWPVLPPKLRQLRWIPNWLLSRRVMKTLYSHTGEVALLAHALAARDEMVLLWEELMGVLKPTTPHLTDIKKFGTPIIENLKT